MANLIQLKRSSVVGKIPDTGNVEVGEPVVNLADRKIYTKNGSGEIIQIAAGNLQALGDVSNASPNTNDVLTWTGSIWSPAIATGGSGSSSNVTVTVSSSPPLSPNIADIWIDSDTSIQYIYFNDGDSSQWAQLDALVSVTSEANVDFKANISDLTTANVVELTNLYYTNTRVQEYLIDNDYQPAADILANTLTTSGGSGEIQFVDGGSNLSSNAGFTYSGGVLYVNYGEGGEVYADAFTANVTITAYGTITASGDIESLSELKGVDLILTGDANVDTLTLLTGVSSNLLPAANLTYDLGSPEKQWKDLWLSNSTIHLGEVSISAQGGNLLLPNTVQIGNVTLSETDGTLVLPEGSSGISTGKAIAMAIVFG